MAKERLVGIALVKAWGKGDSALLIEPMLEHLKDFGLRFAVHAKPQTKTRN